MTQSPITEHKQGGQAQVVPIKDGILSDADIVAGVLNGDPVAGKALVDRFAKRIESRVWRLLGGDSEYQDMVQQVFGQLVATLHKLSDPQALAAWVDTVTVNVVRKEFRRRSYRRIVSFSQDMAMYAVDNGASGDGGDAAFLVKRAFEILKGMNADDRVVFVLRFIEGMPLEEVAATTQCSLATAKRRIGRARDRFTKKAGRDPFLVSLMEKDTRQ